MDKATDSNMMWLYIENRIMNNSKFNPIGPMEYSKD